MATGRRSRALIFVSAVAVLVIGLPITVGASGRGDGGRQRHHVEFTRDPVGQPTLGGPVAGPGGEQLFSVTGSSALAGDFVGTGFGGQWATANQQAQKGATAGVTVWTLTESPCGPGTVIVYVASAPDPMTGPGIWRIAAGAGTGDLAEVSGGGSSQPSAPGQATLYVGRIRCS